MSVLPPVDFADLENREAYEPGDLEKSILSHVVAEYNNDRALCRRVYDRHRLVRDMCNGWFRRRPGDDGELRDLYVPWVAMNQRTRTNIHMSRLIPDPARMDWVTVRVTGDFPQDIIMQMVQQANESDPPEVVGMDPMTGMPQFGPLKHTAQEMMEDISARWTLYLRQVLRRSNYLQSRWSMSINRRRYGGCYGLVSRKWKCVKYAPDDEQIAQEEADKWLRAEEEAALQEMETGNVVEVDFTPSMGDEPIERVEFDGVHFQSILPMNLAVGDLHSDEGVSGLPYATIYDRKSWRGLWDYKVRWEGDTPIGSYANLESLDPRQQVPLPSEDEESTGWAADIQGRSCMAFEVPMRIGQFHAEDVTDLWSSPPSEKDWRGLAKKFGFEYNDLIEKKHWTIEWIHPGRTGPSGGVLLRFQPCDLPYEEDNPSLIVESQNWRVDGRTFGFGDHMVGAGDLEILANNALEDFYVMAQRITRPMYAMDRRAVDPKFWEENKGRLVQVRDGIVPVINQPINGEVLTAIKPPSETVGVSEGVIRSSQETIRQFTGVAAQMEGSGGGADSATEAASQRDYLEQAVRAEMLREENEIDQPLLRRTLQILVDEVNRKGADGVEIVARETDLKLWGDRYEGAAEVKFALTAEMVASGFGIEILTSSSLGDLGEQLTRRERAIGMSASNYQLLMAEGKEPRIAKQLEEYNALLGVADAFRTLTPAEKQMQQQMQQMAMMGSGGGNPGGAGGSRPDYQRSGETSAPGEPTQGLPLMSGTPGVM